MNEYGRGVERTDFPASDAIEAAIGEIRDTDAGNGNGFPSLLTRKVLEHR